MLIIHVHDRRHDSSSQVFFYSIYISSVPKDPAWHAKRRVVMVIIIAARDARDA